MLSTALTYIHDSIEELHHVRWPTRQQAVRLSIIVLAFTLICSAAFGLIDFVFEQLVTFLIPGI